MLALVLAASAVSASDVNVTDSYTTNLVDDTSDDIVSVENADTSDMSVSSDSNMNIDDSSKVSLASEEVLESDNSNTLSTNTVNDTSLSSTNENQEILAAKATQLIPFGDAYYGYPVKVVLKDANGKAISGKTVTFTISGKTYTATTNANGVAGVKPGLNTGKYSATIKFAGDSTYEAQQIKIDFSILPTIKSKAISKYYKGDTQYSATFLNGNGKPLANTYVKISINGKTYNRKTNANGIAYFAINLKPGTYKVTSTDPITGYQLTNTFKILSTIKTADVSKVYTDGKNFYAKFFKNDGNPLAGKSVKFNLNGNNYQVTTNQNGVAHVSLLTLQPGTYKITTYNTNDGLTEVNTIKVVSHCSSKLLTTDYTFLTSDSKVIRATLNNAFNYAPGEGKTIKFTINNNNYYATTNSNGVAAVNVNLDKGIYITKVSYDGNSFYDPSSASFKVVVIPTKTPTLALKSSTTLLKGADNSVKVALTAGGVPLAKRTITFKIDGKSTEFTRTTDDKGIATLAVNLAVGKHTITFTNKAESKVSSSTGSATISVLEKASSSVYWKAGTTFTQGSNIIKVLLQDANKKPLSGKTIKIIANSKTYSAKTASNGYATFKITFPAGTQTVSYKFEGDSYDDPCSGSVKVLTIKKIDNGYGYWVFGGDMKDVNLNTLSSQGVTDIFLNYFAIEKHGKSAVESWIASSNKLGMRVHMWMQVFYDGKWINPVKNGQPDTTLFNNKISEAMGYAKLKGVSGIHFDYLRYPGTAYKTTGGTAAINKFVTLANSRLHNTVSNLIISAALMPEPDDNVKFYGQDYATLSKELDVVVPMIYKGNYVQTTSWITSTTKWFVSNSKGAAVWAGLQAYKSDDVPTPLSTSEITGDSKAAVNANAKGVILFRYGVSNAVDFKTMPSPSSSSSTTPTTDGPTSLSIINIIGGANTIKNYYSKYGKAPSTVTVAKHEYTMPEFLYLMEQAIYQLGNSNTKAIKCIYGVKAPADPSGDSIDSTLSKSAYLTLAKNVATYISNYNRAPNYASSSLGSIIYSELIDSSSRILAFYKNNDNVMPTTVAIRYVDPSSPIPSIPVGGLNVKNTIKDLSPYLKATTNCQVGNSAIRSVVNSITSGLTTDLQKANAIYNYVRDHISYSFYYDTHYGAVGTLNAGTGNCVDQAHLVVAMFRTAGLAARYQQGTCTFSSGSTYGHVWAQVLVNDVWIVSDPTSTRNSFGNVVNWNTNSYSHNGYYASLPF